jgi:invasion protein IalB
VPQPEWQKLCGTVNEQRECHIGRKRLAATGQAIAQFLIIERGDKKIVQIAVPPIALIQPGVRLQVDQNEPAGLKYVVCTPGECLAMGEINAEFIAGLKKGTNLLITMINPQNKPVNFDISLAGFTASYDGPGIDPAQAQANQQKLEDELKRKAEATRQQLLQAQQQQSAQTQ